MTLRGKYLSACRLQKRSSKILVVIVGGKWYITEIDIKTVGNGKCSRNLMARYRKNVNRTRYCIIFGKKWYFIAMPPDILQLWLRGIDVKDIAVADPGQYYAADGDRNIYRYYWGWNETRRVIPSMIQLDAAQFQLSFNRKLSIHEKSGVLSSICRIVSFLIEILWLDQNRFVYLIIVQNNRPDRKSFLLFHSSPLI